MNFWQNMDEQYVLTAVIERDNEGGVGIARADIRRASTSRARCRGQGRGRLASFDGHALAPPRADGPEIGDGEADGSQGGGTGLADAERCGQGRMAAAGDLDPAGPLGTPSRRWPGSNGDQGL